ncbi:hypothetical protein D3C80_865530 [compost metagenome]
MDPDQRLLVGLASDPLGKALVDHQVMVPVLVVELCPVHKGKDRRPERLLGEYTIELIDILF